MGIPPFSNSVLTLVLTKILFLTCVTKCCNLMNHSQMRLDHPVSLVGLVVAKKEFCSPDVRERERRRGRLAGRFMHAK